MNSLKKAERYERIYAQLSDLLIKSDDTTARMATISAVIFHKMDYFFWCGFYKVASKNLVVVTYQGPLACQLLPKNQGVCWAAVNRAETVVVADVNAFLGHIACDSRSKSEIVVPVMNSKGIVVAVLDIDSQLENSFDETDALYLEKIIKLLDIK